MAAILPVDAEWGIYRLILSRETDVPADLNALRWGLEGQFFVWDETLSLPGYMGPADKRQPVYLFLDLLWKGKEAALDERERERIAQAAVWDLRTMDKRRLLI